MRTTINLGAKERAIIEGYPRGVTFTSIFKCLLLSTVSTNEEWRVILSEQPGIMRARDEILKKVRALGRKSLIL